MNHRLFLCPSSQQWEALFIVFRSQLSPSEASSHASYSPSSMYMFHFHGAKITTPASYLIRGAAERLSSGLVYFGTNWKAALFFQWRLSQNSVHRAERHKSEGIKKQQKKPQTQILYLTSWKSWDISHTRQELACISHLCLSDRKKSLSSGVWVRAWTMQFIKHVLPRFIKPLRPETDTETHTQRGNWHMLPQSTWTASFIFPPN